jgi:hypothetical protein
VRRDGVWVTSSGGNGLMLVYDHLPVRRRDGSPVELTWDQLSDRAAAARNLPSGFPIYDPTKLPLGARGRAAERQFYSTLHDMGAPGEPGIPVSEQELEIQHRALDRRELALRRSGLGGAFGVEQLRRIEEERAAT